MLILKERTENTEHKFQLTSIGIGNNITFALTSETYSDFDVSFEMQIPHNKLPIGYTVSVFLFKNSLYSQIETVDLRISGLAANSGKVGYFFRLDALFEPAILQKNMNTYPYAYYAMEHIFSKDSAIQTRVPYIDSRNYKITDFFDDDTIILVLCNEYCSNINNFDLYNYLPNLFNYGFILYGNDRPVEVINKHTFISTKYASIKSIVRPDGVYVLRIESANEVLAGESYITHVFSTLIQKDMDYVTRFLMLYQIIEVLISKVLPYEIQNSVCNNLATFTPSKLKENLNELTNASNIINSIFHNYAKPTESLKIEVRTKILDFFVHIQHPEYTDVGKHASLKSTQLFYALRNKLVHEYREWHKPRIDRSITISKMVEINELSEVLVSDMISNCNLAPLT